MSTAYASVFPAHAGMIRPCCPSILGSPGVPRARGDDPRVGIESFEVVKCSPRTRG